MKFARSTHLPTLLVSSISPLLTASVAFAAEHEAEAEGLSSLILPIINFSVFLALGIYLYKNKVRPMLISRSIDIETALNQAALEERKFEEELATLREALERVDDEEQDVLESFREEGIRSAEDIRRQMLDEVNRVERETEQMKDNLLSQLESDLRDKMTSLAMKKSREKLTTMFTGDMDKNLRKEVLKAFQS